MCRFGMCRLASQGLDPRSRQAIRFWPPCLDRPRPSVHAHRCGNQAGALGITSTAVMPYDFTGCSSQHRKANTQALRNPLPSAGESLGGRSVESGQQPNIGVERSPQLVGEMKQQLGVHLPDAAGGGAGAAPPALHAAGALRRQAGQRAAQVLGGLHGQADGGACWGGRTDEKGRGGYGKLCPSKKGCRSNKGGRRGGFRNGTAPRGAVHYR